MENLILAGAVFAVLSIIFGLVEISIDKPQNE
jgi:hypothetical protein